jgi:sigma-B regulation protein RsbU (phosphoserine phosphatase)
METPAQASPLAVLEEASERDWETGAVLIKALDLWCEMHGVPAAALFASDGEEWELVARSRADGEKSELSPAAAERAESGVSTLRLPGNFLLCFTDGRVEGPLVSGELGLLLAASARLHRVHERLKEQVFQENYKVVTLEALYDVGLSVASTLDLERLCDEILLRAVSLLDARRGALYLVDGDRYRLHRTIGGTALDQVLLAASKLEDLVGAGTAGGFELLPGSTCPLVVSIEVDRRAQGILAVADKESRTGVGPFSEADRRALKMFASQAAIALENAQLHRQALEKERLERELELAAEIQRGLLPARMPSLPGLEVLGWSRPTRQVGGDYYGHLALQGGRVGLVVADVTGKGMPAALLVSTLHSAIHLLLERAAPDQDLVAKLNQHIAESSGANKFITMLLVELDPGAGRLGFLNAGHNPGLLLRASGEVERLSASGLPLGLLRSATYTYRYAEHRAGDLLCLYSDGITECVSRTDEEFGEERLIDYLSENRDAPLAELLGGLDRTVTEFAAGRPQADDQTIVLVRRT